MSDDRVLALVVLVPIFGSLLLPLLGRISASFRNIASLALVLVAAVGSAALLPVVSNNGVIDTVLGNVALFHADRLAVFMSLVSSAIGAIIILYSFGYIKEYEHQNEYYFMAVLFIGAMMGLVYSRNLILTYLFWEITAVACWRLIGFFRKSDYVWRANKAFLITVFGALCMLVGFILIYGQTGSFDLMVSKAFLGKEAVSSLAVAFILMGILSKSATFPLHSWLPDAGVAPSPVTALLHAAVLVKIGCYVYARLFVSTFAIDPFWHTFIPTIAGISALIAGGAAVVENDIKRIIAYSTVSQLGYIILGLSSGSATGIAGALFFILMHAVSKGGLFLCAGIVEHQTHCKDVQKLGGLARVMPLTAAAFLLCAFSIMGFPPFGGFFSKYMVIAGALEDKQLALAMVFMIGAVLTMVYLFRAYSLVFLGDTKLEEKLETYKEGSPVMVFSVVLLALLSILGGVLYSYPSQFVMATVQQMLGTM
jgi:proton-translocating NADH-quinone oxidoreductase chain N